jgi:hypothetical protein
MRGKAKLPKRGVGGMMAGGGTRRLRSTPKAWRIHALVIVAYALLALALTWPLLSRFLSHVPGNGVDDPPLTWNLWWVRHALLDLGTNPFDSDYLFYPLGINLAFYTLTLLNGLLSLPPQAILGLVPASNLLLLSSFVIGGYGAFLLAGYCLGIGRGSHNRGRSIAAFAAGLLHAFAASKLAYASLGQWNIASSQWIPFYVLYLFKIGEQSGRWRYPLMAALFLLLQAYAELTFASFLLLFTLLWTAWHLLATIRSSTARERLRLLADLTLVGFVFVVGLIPVLGMMIPDMLAEGDILAGGGGFADVFSADLLGFLVPTMHHPIFGSLVEHFRFDHEVGQHIYLGYSVLALALLGLVLWWRRARDDISSAGDAEEDATPRAVSPGHLARWATLWSLSALVFWLLSLGPSLRVNGHDTGIPLPFALVARIPFFGGNRYPSRYSVMLFLSLAMLVALGLAAILQRRGLRPRALAVIAALSLVALMLFEHVSIPLPLSDMRVPQVYSSIAQALPQGGTLLDLPVAWRNGFRVTGTQHPTIMYQQYYQSVHGQRLLAGNTSRNPPLKFQYFTEAPLINTLIALETGHQVDPTILEQDRDVGPQVLRFFDAQAIVVRPEAGPDVASYVETALPVQKTYQDGSTVAYQVDLPAWPSTWTIVPGDRLGRLSYAEGWGLPASGVVWAQRPAVRLLVPLDGSEQTMTFRAYTPAGGQQLKVELNGQTVQRISLAAGWMNYEFALPAEIVRKGLNEVWLRFAAEYPASQVRLSPRTIGETGTESPVNLVVQSAGQEVGDFAHIYVDGLDVSPNRRGYNVAVLDPTSGSVEAVAVFDTHLDPAASRALAAFLDGVPSGRIVAVAIADEASRLLDEDAVIALQGIGATGDLRDKFRWGQAIIGVKGAAPGTALEALNWIMPVSAVAGEGATEPHLTAAFGAIEFAATGAR